MHFQNTFPKLLSQNDSFKIHSQNCSLKKYLLKICIFKITLSKKYIFSKNCCYKNTFVKLLPGKVYFQNYHFKKHIFKFVSPKIHFQKCFLKKYFFKKILS